MLRPFGGTDHRRLKPVHLEGLDNSGQDTATDAHITSEGALLVNVVSVDGLKHETKFMKIIIIIMKDMNPNNNSINNNLYEY